MTYKALLLISVVLFLTGCESMRQAYDFGVSHCQYEKVDGKRKLTCAL